MHFEAGLELKSGLLVRMVFTVELLLAMERYPLMAIQIPTADFDTWVQSLGKEVTMSEVSKKSGIPEPTLSHQRKEERIKPTTVLKTAAGFGKHKLMELASFDGFGNLWPLPEELPWLACVSPVDIAAELMGRRQIVEPAPDYVYEVAEDACTRWHSLIDGGAKRMEVAERLGMPKNRYSRLVVANSLQFETVLDVAGYFDVSPHVGLVACGYLTLSDIGVLDVPDTLASVGDEVLLAELEARQKVLLKSLAG